MASLKYSNHNAPDPSTAKRLASVTHLMAYADISRSTAYRLVASGDIKAYKSGRILRVDLDSVDAWLKPVKGARS